MLNRFNSLIILVATCAFSFSFTLDIKGWERYYSKDGGYSVEMPGSPTASSSSVDTEVGAIIINTSMYEDKESDELYMVGYNRFPNALYEAIKGDNIIQNNMLLGAKNGAMNSLSQYGTNTVVDDEEFFKFDDKYIALKVKAHNGEHYVNAVFFLKGALLYQVWKMKLGDYSTKADKFFDSFELM